MWPLALREDLRAVMVEEQIRKVDRWTARYRLVQVEFPDIASLAGPLDPFFNTNRPKDLEESARYLG